MVRETQKKKKLNALAYITGNHHISFNSAVLSCDFLFVFLREKKKKLGKHFMHPKKHFMHAQDWATKQTHITLLTEESFNQGKESWGIH